MLNFLLAGYYLGDGWFKDIIYPIPVFILFACIASPLFVIDHLWYLLRITYAWVNNTFQVSFYFTYYFTKMWDNIEVDKLIKLNGAKDLRNKDTFRDRVFRHTLKLVNKRNNFDPSANE
jgi:hypothetical protein